MQCPQFTNLHPDPNSAAVQTALKASGLTYQQAYPGNVLCQQVSGGDGFVTMGDGHQIYLFGFGPLSGLQDIYAGLPGTETNTVFNSAFAAKGGIPVGSVATNSGAANSGAGAPTPMAAPAPNNAAVVEPAQVMNVGVLNASQPAPLMAINEDDEFYLTLSNVGMINRPDLFEQHTIHFHGYPNASSFFDGVPDASVAINIAGSFTYYYTAPDAGTYFWHCHISPPEHLQMGMVGQLYVRPRQNQVAAGTSLYAAAVAHKCLSSDFLCSAPLPPKDTGAMKPAAPVMYAYNDGDGSTAYDVDVPIQMMSFDPNFHFVGMTFNPEDFSGMKDKYFLLNGRSYPDTIIPNCGANCVAANDSQPVGTMANDGITRMSQPLPALVTIDRTKGQTRALLRLSQLTVTEFATIATVGVPMHVVGWNARLLRDMAGNDMTYYTNSVTLGGGESADAIIDVSDTTQYPPKPGQQTVFYLYSTNLDHLSNDAENFGGQMSEIVIQD